MCFYRLILQDGNLVMASSSFVILGNTTSSLEAYLGNVPTESKLLMATSILTLRYELCPLKIITQRKKMQLDINRDY
jgi:hypothetical protein